MSDIIDIEDAKKKSDNFKKFDVKKLKKEALEEEIAYLGSDLTYQKLRWIIPNLVLEKGLSLIVGDAKIGKTLLVMSLIAEAQKKYILPDEKIIYLGGEDDANSGVYPRAKIAGVDMNRFVIWEGIKDTENGDIKYVDLIENRKNFVRMIEKHNAKLIIIDTLGKYLGDTNICSVGDIRKLLSPLDTLSQKTSCGILIIHHTHKSKEGDAVQRIHGSGALYQTCRAIAQFTVNPQGDGQRILSALPGNFTSMDSKYTRIYETQKDMRIFDGEIVEDYFLRLTDSICLDSANEILAQQESFTELTAKKRAENFLIEALKDGKPHPSNQILRDAKELGFPKYTIYRAIKNLPVEIIIKNDNKKNGTIWILYMQFLGKLEEFNAFLKERK